MFLWLFLAAVAASSRGPKLRPIKARTVKRAKFVEPQGINVFGPGGTYEPDYLKTVGCTDVRWAFCFDMLRDEWYAMSQAEEGKAAKQAKAVKKAEEIYMKIMMAVEPQGTKIAKWLVDHICFRFLFKLRAYNERDGSRWYAITPKFPAMQLDAAAPPHPFPPLKGYKRVWISKTLDTMTRSPETISVFWPTSEEGGGVEAELAGRRVIRGLLRMSPEYPGALQANQLKAAECGKGGGFTVATRKQAKKWWSG